ncbi:hypothetical protein IW261DRAFT_1423662 [Armillaria novae-zelandiae]|uniref:DUF6535 domain-containing protein n=1 Tax=Armillaria novae-zelandiae TaxID=153914 RepID=A0AA39NXL8_9AGAR|nr:hypothetical protein IW261DRAFT_1423662 [Armillaria novae-zelandiae]
MSNRLRTLDQDPGQDRAIVGEDIEADSQGIGGSGEHPHNSIEQDEAPPLLRRPLLMQPGRRGSWGCEEPFSFYLKYPEDERYEEAAPEAKVWKTFEDESRKHHIEMVEESRDSLNVLLVFAGLFSSVVTTFVAQTSQSLQPNYTAMSAALLYESVLVQRAIANGSSVNSIAPSPLNPTVPFVPVATDVWVNALWFTSLFLSLTTALVAFLVNQWLHYYLSLTSGTLRDRSLMRHFRRAGFQKWHVLVIIDSLPILMHLALAMFLIGLGLFLQPLRQALSWVICAGTILVYTAYVVATVLPIIFPQCPYRTPLCDLVNISLYLVSWPVTWGLGYWMSFSSYGQRNFKAMFLHLLSIRERHQQSLATIETKFVQQTSTDLVPEVLSWLLSVSSDPAVPSIVLQTIGGLPMALEEKCLVLREKMRPLWYSLLSSHLQFGTAGILEPVPGMELGLERLLRFNDPRQFSHSKISHNSHSYELDAAISFNGSFIVRDTGSVVSPGACFVEILLDHASGSKLPPRCWLLLVRRAAEWGVFKTLNPDKNYNDEDYDTNMFPLRFCSAILHSFGASPEDQIQDLNSPSALDFNRALPFFRHKIYDNILVMLSKFVQGPSLSQSQKVMLAAIKFLLHRLCLPECDNRANICQTLTAAIQQIPGRVFSSQEATAFMVVFEDIITTPHISQLLNIESDWFNLRENTIQAHHYLTDYAPSARSLHALQSTIDSMKSHWDQIGDFSPYKSDTACRLLTDLLKRRDPVAFTVFHEMKCLPFLGSHNFHGASIPMLSEYISGISTMQHGSDENVDGATLHLQQHIDNIHDPQNLFTVCFILATRGAEVDWSALEKDINALVWLHPQDTAWGVCRRQLHDLVQSKGGEFFRKQLIWHVSSGDISIQAYEIEVEKENIRYVIHLLDEFFIGGGRAKICLDSLSEWHSIGHIQHLLRRHLRRKPGSEPGQSIFSRGLMFKDNKFNVKLVGAAQVTGLYYLYTKLLVRYVSRYWTARTKNLLVQVS